MEIVALSQEQLARRAELDEVIRRNKEGFAKMAIALAEIKAEGLWASTHKNFGDYCTETLGIGYSSGYRCAQMGEVLMDLKGIGGLPLSQRQVQPLIALNREDRQAAWAQVEAVVEAGAAPLTQDTVQRVIKAVKAGKCDLTPGQIINVSRGEFLGKEALVKENNGVIVYCEIDGQNVALLSSELRTEERGAPKKSAEVRLHPLAEEVESLRSLKAVEEARVSLLEGLLREALGMLSEGLRSRVMKVL